MHLALKYNYNTTIKGFVKCVFKKKKNLTSRRINEVSERIVLWRNEIANVWKEQTELSVVFKLEEQMQGYRNT